MHSPNMSVEVAATLRHVWALGAFVADAPVDTFDVEPQASRAFPLIHALLALEGLLAVLCPHVKLQVNLVDVRFIALSTAVLPLLK